MTKKRLSTLHSLLYQKLRQKKICHRLVKKEVSSFSLNLTRALSFYNCKKNHAFQPYDKHFFPYVSKSIFLCFLLERGILGDDDFKNNSRFMGFNVVFEIIVLFWFTQQSVF